MGRGGRYDLAAADVIHSFIRSSVQSIIRSIQQQQGVVEEYRQNGGSTSSASTAATAGTGPEGSGAGARAGPAGTTTEVTNKEEI